MGPKRASHAVYDAAYHPVWCPKYRKKIFEREEMGERAGQLIREICEEYGIEIEEMEVAAFSKWRAAGAGIFLGDTPYI